MNGEKFEKLSRSLLDQCEKTMFSKAKEYATEDRLYNFRQPTSMMKVSPAEVCLFYQMKHIASITKIGREITAGKAPSREMLREKCQDIINYTLLFHALVEEEIEKQEATMTASSAPATLSYSATLGQLGQPAES